MTVGYVVLYLWPLIVFAFFRTWSPPVALLAAILGGYLLLPTGLALDLPVLPSLDKSTLPSLAAFLASIFALKRLEYLRHSALKRAAHSRPHADLNTDGYLSSWLPHSTTAKILLFMIMMGSLLTVLTNGDVLVYGHVVRPAMRPWDAFATMANTFITLLPLLLARKFLALPNQNKLILQALLLTGLSYSFLALYEVRMSPQLNYMIYGFFPHSWAQHIRGDGFRPVVFLSHGLWLSIFFAITVLASAGLVRKSSGKQMILYIFATLWLLMTLILTKSLGATAIGITLLICILFLGRRLNLTLAACLAFVALTYPILRGFDLMPVEIISSWAEKINPARAESFDFRITNEDALLEKAQERPLFGWGSWARNFVFDDNGQSIATVADGYWVLIIGTGGWLRYLSEFGFLCFPIILCAINARRYSLGWETSAISVILAANVFDLLPNATITPVTWLLAGALWGRLELGNISEADQISVADSKMSREISYRRPTKQNYNLAGLREKPQERYTTTDSPYTRQRTRFNRSATKSGEDES